MKSDRIVFRHCQKTVECYSLDGSWHASVQGVKNPRGPFDTPGRAVQEGIAVAEKHNHIHKRVKSTRSKKNPKLQEILRKASR